MYKEIARNRKPDGRYQPWYAHSQAHQRRRRPKVRVFTHDDRLRRLVADKLGKRWSPGQISRWLRRRYPRRTEWHVCVETIYEAGDWSWPQLAGLCAPGGPIAGAVAAGDSGTVRSSNQRI